MKICILTHPLKTNYGGLLQAFALQKVLRDMGHDVVTDKYGISNYRSTTAKTIRFVYHFIFRYILGKKAYNPYRYLLKKYDNGDRKDIELQLSLHTRRFVDNHINCINFFEGKTAPRESILSQFDALIVGSDQVWRSEFGYQPAYFLDFTKDINIKRLAYAASFGKNSITLSYSHLRQCRQSAKLFDAISVREDSGVTLCRDYFDMEAEHLLDPTMLLSKDDYISTIEEKDKTTRDNVLMCYVLDKTNEKDAIIKKTSKALNLQELHVMPEVAYSSNVEDISKCVFPSVSKWLAGFRDAKFVVTDSFHGTVFSIIFNVPFIAIDNSARGSARFNSLLKIFGLEDRLISSIGEVTDELLAKFDCEPVNNIKHDWQRKSIDFLQKNLMHNE